MRRSYVVNSKFCIEPNHFVPHRIGCCHVNSQGIQALVKKWITYLSPIEQYKHNHKHERKHEDGYDHFSTYL